MGSEPKFMNKRQTVSSQINIKFEIENTVPVKGVKFYILF